MTAQPGRQQAAFTAGELDPLLHDRTELKYFSTGLSWAENVEISPQGGFRVRDGMRDVGAVNANATRLFPFDASNGVSYDLVFSPNLCAFWSSTAQLATVATNVTSGMLAELTSAQQLDTMLLFHDDLQTQRIKHLGPTSWQIDNAPFTGISNYDYGAAYVNGVSAKWRLQFVGLTTGATGFVLTVSGQETPSIVYNSTTATMAADIQTKILALPNISPGVTAVALGADLIEVTFAGAGNEGDGWSISGRVLNKADAAVLAAKTVVGIVGGEPVISATRGWPHCGCFYGQRLILGGPKSLPNAWIMSKVGEYYNLNERFTEATGPAIIPMDVPGGERIERIIAGRNLLIFTSKAEYWLAERALSRTTAPNHVQASRHGSRRGAPIVENEGAAIFLHSTGGVLGEFRYTDVEGNFVSTDISLLASHLLSGGVDMARRASSQSRDGNLLAIVNADGSARGVTILREQEVTAFARHSTDGLLKACSVNGRNELMWLTQRMDGRRLERSEDGLLLDAAVSFAYGPPTATIGSISRFNGKTVWVIADNQVFGSFVVSGGAITLPVAVSNATVGLWTPPKVTTLPPPRDVGPNTVLKRRGRIHTVRLSLIDTTSVAIAVNGGALQDLDLVRFGATANVPELLAPFDGEIVLQGLTGYADRPTLTISQVRPGRLTVRSLTVEAKL